MIRCIRITASIITLLLIVPFAFADDPDFSGTWHISAGNQKYTMDLSQRGTEVYGNLVPLSGNRQLQSIVYGTAYGNRLTLNAHNKNFTLVLNMKGVMSGKGTDRAIKGTLKKNNRYLFNFSGIRY